MSDPQLVSGVDINSGGGTAYSKSGAAVALLMEETETATDSAWDSLRFHAEYSTEALVGDVLQRLCPPVMPRGESSRAATVLAPCSPQAGA